MVPYPFPEAVSNGAHDGDHCSRAKPVTSPNSRGRMYSLQAARLRAMILESWQDPNKILATCAADDALTARLVEDAGFPFIFLGGYAVAASLGLPDTGYIAFQEMATRVQEVSRRVQIPVLVDGDTGYGSPLNVRRTVEGFARAGAAGVMIEDQTWPKKCGHTKGKKVVSREEAFARIQAAVDARDEGVDVVILARTDSLILGWEEAIHRASTFAKMGADLIFIEALPDRAAMEKAAQVVNAPLLANIIEGGLTENISAKDLAQARFAMVAYPFTVVAAKIKAVREALEQMKESLTVGAPPQILSAAEVCKAVGFEEYYKLEERYRY